MFPDHQMITASSQEHVKIDDTTNNKYFTFRETAKPDCKRETEMMSYRDIICLDEQLKCMSCWYSLDSCDGRQFVRCSTKMMH